MEKLCQNMSKNGRNHAQKNCTYLAGAASDCFAGLLLNSGCARSLCRFVGFHSTRQRHHSCEESIEKMGPCKFLIPRSKWQIKVRFTVI